MKPTPLALLLLLASAACKKDDVDPDGLVRTTQQGKNTGDFLIDDKPFNPLPGVATPANKPVGAFWDHFGRGNSNIQISFFRQERDVNRTEKTLNLLISNIRQVGTYKLTDEINPFVIPGAQSFAQYTLPGVFPAIRKYHLTGPTSPGQVIITRFDTVARVVSGTFEARLHEYGGPDSLSITKGRFDCSF